jgi:hypothetical protein
VPPTRKVGGSGARAEKRQEEQNWVGEVKKDGEKRGEHTGCIWPCIHEERRWLVLEREEEKQEEG